MGRKRTPGLYKRKDIWHIDKQVNGIRISESTSSDNLEEAEKYLARRIEGIRQASVYGVRQKRTFSVAAAKFILEYQHKKSIDWDIRSLKILNNYIGHLYLESINMCSLQLFISHRKEAGVKNRTINQGLQVVRRILNLAASEWMDEFGLTWLAHAPKIKLLHLNDARKAYPLDWNEQDKIFVHLPNHLRRMALFAVNTGCRDQEICNLEWEWEIKIFELNSSVFVIPGCFTKNGQDRLVILNKIALSVIEEVRDMNTRYVFVYHNKKLSRMNNKAWRRARNLACLPYVRVHDLKHTFGRRLRSAGVSFEDRQDLLGHKSSRITTHYSAAEITNLLEAANKVCAANNRPALTLLKHVNRIGPAKVPQESSWEKGSP